MSKNGKSGGGRSQASNDARSNSMNPNNAAFHASQANRADQLNPDHAAYGGAREGSMPTKDGQK